MKKKNRPKVVSRRIDPSIIVVVFLLLVGAVWFFVPQKGFSTTESKKSEDVVIDGESSQLIPVPVRTIAKGEPLSPEMFTEIRWPKSRLNASYVVDSAVFQNAFAAQQLPELIPVPKSLLSLVALKDNPVAESIPEGMRAITVKVDAESGVEGWAGAGNRVDVLLVKTSQTQGGSGLESYIVAENVRILSAGRSAEPQANTGNASNAPSTVTLLTTQEDALKIKMATTLGKLAFALRGSNDVLPSVTHTVTQQRLFALGKAAQQPVQKSYSGTAVGPDGKTYVLSGENKWVRASNSASEVEGE